MSLYTTTRDAIKAAIQAADTTATVHDRKRIPSPLPTDNELADLLIEKKADGTEQVHVWMFTRISAPNATIVSESGNIHSVRNVTESWKIFGYLSFDDTGSEYTFQDTVDSIRESLATHADMIALRNSHSAYIQDISVAVLDEGLVTGQHLCHYCEIFVTIVFQNIVL